MLEELTTEQWDEWVEFYSLEPWGFDVDDGLNALLASTIACTWGAAVTPDQFLIGNKMPGRAESVVDVEEKVKRMFGHKDYVKGPPAEAPS